MPPTPAGISESSFKFFLLGWGTTGGTFALLSPDLCRGRMVSSEGGEETKTERRPPPTPVPSIHAEMGRSTFVVPKREGEVPSESA